MIAIYNNICPISTSSSLNAAMTLAASQAEPSVGADAEFAAVTMRCSTSITCSVVVPLAADAPSVHAVQLPVTVSTCVESNSQPIARMRSRSAFAVVTSSEPGLVVVDVVALSPSSLTAAPAVTLKSRDESAVASEVVALPNVATILTPDVSAPGLPYHIDTEAPDCAATLVEFCRDFVSATPPMVTPVTSPVSPPPVEILSSVTQTTTKSVAPTACAVATVSVA